MEKMILTSMIKPGLSLLACFCLGSHVWAGEMVDRVLDIQPDSYIDIEHQDGLMQVKTWDKNQIRVVGELHEKAQGLIFELRGDKVRLEVDMPKSGHHSRKNVQGDQLEVYVPSAVMINYEAVNASFEGQGFKGGANIETVNGDVEIDGLTGRLDIETINGDVKARMLQGVVRMETVNGSIQDLDSKAEKASYKSVNGDIEADTQASELNAETVNGDMELSLGQTNELDLTAVNGSIDASLTLLPKGDVQVNTVGGSTKLAFQSDVSARFEIEAHAGGRIRNLLSSDEVRKAKYGPGRSLEFSHGGGDARVKVSTVHGRVTLASH